MNSTNLEILGTVFFALAVLHSFFVGQILKWSHHFSKDSIWANLLHLASELEVVFALWAALFMLVYALAEGWGAVLAYQSSLDFTEPFFIFVIMVICSSRPILTAARIAILKTSGLIQKIFKTSDVLTDISVLLILGPLSGSFITEPAAMIVTASLLNAILPKQSAKIIYSFIAVLFVNISIGGGLTPYAAPPILMVAKTWGWDFHYVFFNLGIKCIPAVVLNSLVLVLFHAKFLKEKAQSLKVIEERVSGSHVAMPKLVMWVHLVFLFGVVLTSHYQNAFMAVFLLFLGVASVSARYHDQLRLKESLLVAMFLGGIIEFGAFQKWWLIPLLSGTSDHSLFVSSVLLTAVTDNAALTYLGSQVEGLLEASKYALVAGAIAGGGLTVIANSPNAAGYAVLANKLEGGLRPFKLFKLALLPTLVAILCLWIL